MTPLDWLSAIYLAGAFLTVAAILAARLWVPDGSRITAWQCVGFAFAVILWPAFWPYALGRGRS